MASINISRNHSKSLSEIKNLIDDLASDVKKEYGVDMSWQDERSLSISGTGIKSGSVNISDSNIEINIKLGMLASAFKGKIEDGLNSKLDELL